MELIRKKAKDAFAVIGQPLCVDDFGFYIEKFNKFPGALTKFIFKSLGYDGLLRLVDQDDRAYYKSLIAYTDGTNLEVFEGILKGRINKEVPSEYVENSPINSVFIPDGYTEVFEKSKQSVDFISHRKIALEKLKEYLLSL
jgi:non-canonical purine NTP pyrophosphatase (RdgB/HAM1 family)